MRGNILVIITAIYALSSMGCTSPTRQGVEVTKKSGSGDGTGADVSDTKSTGNNPIATASDSACVQGGKCPTVDLKILVNGKGKDTLLKGTARKAVKWTITVDPVIESQRTLIVKFFAAPWKEAAATDTSAGGGDTPLRLASGTLDDSSASDADSDSGGDTDSDSNKGSSDEENDLEEQGAISFNVPWTPKDGEKAEGRFHVFVRDFDACVHKKGKAAKQACKSLTKDSYNKVYDTVVSFNFEISE